MNSFDVILLGGGSAAEVIAPRLARAGRSVAVVEQRLVGGECPYFACVPSKALLLAGRDGVDWEAAVRRRDEATGHGDDSETVHRLEDEGVTVLRGRGRVTGPGRCEVDGREIGWTDLVVNTGSEPSMPPVEGLDSVPTWTSDQALVATERPDRLAVLGGGPVGCELAQAYAAFGTHVTLVETADQLLSGEAAFVGDRLAAALRDHAIEVRTGVTAQRAGVQAGGVRLALDDGSTVSADRILVATGRRPSTDGLGLDHLGVTPDDSGALQVDDHCRVRGQQHVWAAGDVTGVAPFTHTANYQGGIIADAMLEHPRRADYRAIPRAVYTRPAVWCVGEAPGGAGSSRLTVHGFDIGESARGWLEGADGRVEIYTDPVRRVVVGAAAIGPHADSSAAELAVAVRAAVPLDVLADVVHAFPSFGEALEPPLRRAAGRVG